ncbi:MAG: hypothetical protein PVF97_09280 [Desulfobacterales bacterium]
MAIAPTTYPQSELGGFLRAAAFSSTADGWGSARTGGDHRPWTQSSPSGTTIAYHSKIYNDTNLLSGSGLLQPRLFWVKMPFNSLDHPTRYAAVIVCDDAR